MATQPQSVHSGTQTKSAGAVLAFFLTWGLVIIVAVLSVRALHAPAPEPATASDNEFSAERALIHVREIARVSHPIGSKANEAVRNYLLAQLTQLGLQAQVFSAIGVDPTTQGVVAGETHDITARLAGAAGGPAVLLMAHYDSVSRAPGAADDGSGVASILEAVRALRHGSALKRDLIVLFTEGEEPGLLGAEAFAHSHPWVKDVGLIMNFDARGNQGPSLLFETSTNNRPLIEAVKSAAPHPIGSSLFYELYKTLPNDTDFTVFRPLKIPGLNFAFGEGLEGYHTPLDTPGNLSPASLQHDGSYALSLTRYFGNSELTDLKTANQDDVFFDWFGSSLVAYGQRWVLPGEVLVTIVLALAILLAAYKAKVRLARLLLALLGCLALMVLIALVARVGWWIMAFLLAGKMILSDSTANLLLLCGLLLLGAYAGAVGVVLLRKHFSTLELTIAGLILWWIASWLLVIRMPAASYVLFWPLLLGALGVVTQLLGSRVPDSKNQWIFALPGAVTTLLLFAPVAYLLYIFLTLEVITVIASAVLLGLFFLICFPLMEVNVAVRPRWVSVCIVVASFVCLGVGGTLSHYSPEHPRRDTMLYSLNADDNTALWITYDQQPDRWTKQFLTDKPQGAQPLPSYLAGFPRALVSASAPIFPLSPPVMENVEHKVEGQVHRLKLTLKSTRGAEVLYLRFADEVQPVSLKISGRDVPVQPGRRFGVILFGMGEKGAELELAISTTGNSPLSFWVMDRSSGLPGSAEPRPNTLMGAEGSDLTYVCRKYSL